MRKAIGMAAVLSCATLSAQAETIEDMKFGDLMTLKMMDTNKDGMVSKAEFQDMMGKLWDAKAKKMGVKGGRMSTADLDQILQYLRAGS